MATARTRGQLYMDGALHNAPALPDGITTIIMDPDDADAAAAATERWTDATGAIAFRVIPKGAASAVGSLDGIIFGWSLDADDLTAVNARMATLDAGLASAASGGTEVSKVGVLMPVKAADGTTGWAGNTEWVVPPDGYTIKTIAVRSSGADYTAGVVVQIAKFTVG